VGRLGCRGGLVGRVGCRGWVAGLGWDAGVSTICK
jgi:hypothetical protein